MKVLFVVSGNKATGISPIVANQKASLIRKGLEIDVFEIRGKGIKGYLKNIPLLRKHIKNTEYDVVHAHYSLSGILAALAGCKPLVVSLMGSDTKTGQLLNLMIKTFNRLYWSACIVKSAQMAEDIKISQLHVIPNGVNFNKFCLRDQSEARARLDYAADKKHIIFAADPKRPEKNYDLAQEAIALTGRADIQVHFLKNVRNDEVSWHFSAADLILLTSKREGSPNVIKEAMACNRPVVCTNAGDVKTTIGNTENCYVCSHKAKDIAEKINLVLEANITNTNGRENIANLEESIIADRIIQIYKSVIKN